MKIPTIFFLLFLCFPVVTASINYNIGSNTITISDENVGINDVDNAVNSNVIHHSDTTYTVDCAIQLRNGAKLYIDPSHGCTNLDLSENGKLWYNQDFYIENVKITGGKEIGTKGRFRNVYLYDSAPIRLDGIQEDVFNITIKDSAGGLSFIGSNNINIYNIHIENIRKSGIWLHGCSNVNVYDCRLINCGDYHNPSYDLFGLNFDDSCGYCTANNIYIDGTGWSSLEATGKDTHHISFKNCEIHNSGHNGLDFHGGDFITAENIIVYNSDADNYLVVFTDNVELQNIKSYNAGYGRGISVAEYVDDFSINGYYCDESDNAITTFHASAPIFRNIVSDKSNNYGVIIAYVGRSVKSPIFINCDLTASNYGIKNVGSDTAKFINTKYERYLGNNKAIFYYYYHIGAVDNNDNLLPNIDIKVSSPAVDGDGKDKTSFTTGNNGFTSLPNIKTSNSVCLADYEKNGDGTYIHDIIIGNTKLFGIDPDSSLYREYDSISPYSIIGIVNPNTNVLGYAPHSKDEYIIGYDKKFKVWTDGGQSSTEWFVDNVKMSSNTMFHWTVLSGIHAIKVVVIGTKGTYEHVWTTVGLNSPIPPPKPIPEFTDIPTNPHDKIYDEPTPTPGPTPYPIFEQTGTIELNEFGYQNYSANPEWEYLGNIKSNVVRHFYNWDDYLTSKENARQIYNPLHFGLPNETNLCMGGGPIQWTYLRIIGPEYAVRYNNSIYSNSTDMIYEVGYLPMPKRSLNGVTIDSVTASELYHKTNAVGDDMLTVNITCEWHKTKRTATGTRKKFYTTILYQKTRNTITKWEAVDEYNETVECVITNHSGFYNTINMTGLPTNASHYNISVQMGNMSKYILKSSYVYFKNETVQYQLYDMYDYDFYDLYGVSPYGKDQFIVPKGYVDNISIVVSSPFESYELETNITRIDKKKDAFDGDIYAVVMCFLCMYVLYRMFFKW